MVDHPPAGGHPRRRTTTIGPRLEFRARDSSAVRTSLRSIEVNSDEPRSSGQNSSEPRHESEHGDTSPLKEAFTVNAEQTLQGTLFASGYGVVFHLTLVFLPTWLSEYTSMDLSTAMRINTAATALLVVLVPVMAWITDRCVRRTHLIRIAVAGIALTILPLHSWMETGALAGAVVTAVAVVSLTWMTDRSREPLAWMSDEDTAHTDVPGAPFGRRVAFQSGCGLGSRLFGAPGDRPLR